MKRNANKAILAALAVGIAFAVSACQGRKASNMIPLGETVEVMGDVAPEAPADSVADAL